MRQPGRSRPRTQFFTGFGNLTQIAGGLWKWPPTDCQRKLHFGGRNGGLWGDFLPLAICVNQRVENPTNRNPAQHLQKLALDARERPMDSKPMDLLPK
jgi:hypothetical protein